MSGNDSEQNCLFCRMINGVEAATIVFSDEEVVGLLPRERDARVHVLLAPRKHLPSVDALAAEDRELWWHLLEVAQQLARRQGIDIEGEGYHLVTNAGRHGSRAYPHLHLHLASGALE
jgi:histidine triad (HIT) family protein